MTGATVQALDLPPSGVIKANNTLDLNQGDSWVGGAAPQSGQIAAWDATVTAANTTALGLDPIWWGIRIADPGGLVTINGGSISLGGGGINMATATNNLALNATLSLNTWQDWNIGTGRTVSLTNGIHGSGQILTKTGGGTVRVVGNASFESLNIHGGRVETTPAGGAISAPGGVTLGGAGAINPTLALATSPGAVPSLFVAPGTSGATLDLTASHGGVVNFSDVILASPLTIRRALPTTNLTIFVMSQPIVGGTAPGTDALIFSAATPGIPTNWLTGTGARNDFTGNVRFAFGLWSPAASDSTPNRIIPDASLLTIAAPAQVTWATSEIIDGLAGAGRLNLTGTSCAVTISPNNPANDGARVFSGALTQVGTTPSLAFAGSGTQVLAGSGITYGGPTSIASGKLVLRDATAFRSASVAVNGGTLELESTSGAWTFAKPINGEGDLVKSGPGTVTLTAAATHSGKTTITGGTLALGTGGSLANTGQVVIEGGNFSVSALPSGYHVSALLGTGSVTGSLTVASRLALGNSAGTMDFQNLTLGAGAVAEFEVTGGGAAADLGNVSGQLDLNGASLSLLQLGSYTPDQKYTLFAYTIGNLLGTFGGLADNAEFTAAGGRWRIAYQDPVAGLNGGTGNRFVTVTSVPEPATAAMLSLALTAMLRRRKR
jgi:autotransporter-associated beta strand protein